MYWLYLTRALSEKGVSLAQTKRAGSRIPAGTQLQNAEDGLASGPTRRLPHLDGGEPMGAHLRDREVEERLSVDVKVIIMPPCIFFYGKSLMKYAGRCQSDFNVQGQERLPVQAHRVAAGVHLG
jgi:hypothetical protein